MAEASIGIIIAVATIALMFAWIQILNFAIGHRYSALKRLRLRNMRRDKGVPKRLPS
jgi:hypothetical protein